MNTILLIIICILLLVVIFLLLNNRKSKNEISISKIAEEKQEPVIKIIDPKPEHVYYKIHEKEIEQNKLSRSYSDKNLDIEDKSSVFYDKNIVITGSFTTFSRSDIAELLYSKGAAIKGAITSNTDIVIIGSINPGPSKLLKIEKLIKESSKLQVIQEDEFIAIIRKEKTI